VDFKLRDWKTPKGIVNFRLRLDPINAEIIADECKMNIKSNSVSITLKKAEVGKKWEDLHEVLVQEEDTRPKDP
jgi:hypothetical protein